MWDTSRREAQDAINDSWGSISPNLRIDWNTAPGSCEDGDVRIHVDDVQPTAAPWDREFTLNFTFNNFVPACNANEADRVACLRANAVHEFGHILGFGHENNRSSAGSTCPNGTTINPDTCLLYTSPSPRDATLSRMPSSA